MKGLAESKPMAVSSWRWLKNQPNSTGTAVFHLQNEKSVNSTAGMCFYFSTRKSTGVKWSSVDQADLVASGTGL